MGESSLFETLQTLVELIEQSRQLRERCPSTVDEMRRMDVLIDWTLQSLREGIVSETAAEMARVHSMAG